MSRYVIPSTYVPLFFRVSIETARNINIFRKIRMKGANSARRHGALEHV